MNRPSKVDCLLENNPSLWSRLVSTVANGIPRELRCRVDSQQIVNDSLYAWNSMHRHEVGNGIEEAEGARHLNLLYLIVRNRLLDAIRKERRLKRGRPIPCEAHEQLISIANAGCIDLHAELECDEMLHRLRLHLNEVQQSILTLRMERYQESEIAELLGLSVITVHSARKQIVEIASVFFHNESDDRQGTRNKEQGTRNKEQGNFAVKANLEDSQISWMRRHRLTLLNNSQRTIEFRSDANCFFC